MRDFQALVVPWFVFRARSLCSNQTSPPPPPVFPRLPLPSPAAFSSPQQYTRVAGVEYPGAYNDFLAVIDLVNLDLGFILSFACIYDTTFYDRLLIATLGPIATLAALACIYWVARRRNGHSEEAMSRVKHIHLSVALFVMFVVYSMVSYTIFQTFACEDMDDGKSYLRADYSITCHTAEHRAYEVWLSRKSCVCGGMKSAPLLCYVKG